MARHAENTFVFIDTWHQMDNITFIQLKPCNAASPYDEAVSWCMQSDAVADNEYKDNGQANLGQFDVSLT